MNRRRLIGLSVLVLVLCLVGAWGHAPGEPRQGSFIEKAARSSGSAASAGSSRSPPPSAPQPEPRLGGTVERDGTPATRARVVVQSLRGGGRHERESDEAGRFAFDGLPSGRYRVTATWEGLLGATLVELAPDAGIDDLVVALEDAGSLVGEVHDDSGRPLADVEVTAVTADERLLELSTTTDPLGRFLLAPAGRGLWRLRAQAAGYPPAEVDIAARVAGESRVSLVLKALEGPGDDSLTGMILDEQGSPVAGASLYAAHKSLAQPSGYRRTNGFTRSGPDGRFSITELLPAPFELRVWHPDFVDLTREVLVPSREVVMVLPSGLHLVGEVQDGRGHPVSGARVSGLSGRSARTDASGTFRLAGLSPGPCSLMVEAKVGLESDTNSLTTKLTLPHEERVILRFGAGAIRGRVLMRAGTEVEGARITAQSVAPGRTASRYRGQSTSNEEGRFVLDGLSPGTYEVWAHFERAGIPFAGHARAETGAETIEIQLARRAAVVSGSVTGEHGRPLAHFAIDGQPFHSPTGRFQVAAPGSGTLVIQAHGHAALRHPLPPARDGDIDVGALRLKAGRWLEGRVLDEVEAPVPGAVVQLSEPAAPDSTWSATSGSDGWFVVGPVSEDATEALVRHRDFLDLVQTVATAESPTLVLQRGASIEGQVFDSEGRPWPFSEVLVQAAAVRKIRTADEHGRFRVGGLPPGSASISVWPRGPALRIELTSERTARVELRDGVDGVTLLLQLDAGPGVWPLLVPGFPQHPASVDEFLALSSKGLPLERTDETVWRAEQLLPGDYTVFVIRSGRPVELHRQTFSLSDEPDQSLSLAVPEVFVQVPPD